MESEVYDSKCNPVFYNHTDLKTALLYRCSYQQLIVIVTCNSN